MKITNFNLEKWYVKYEFSTKYNLSASGIKTLKLNDLNLNSEYSDLPLTYSPGQGNSELINIIAQTNSVSPESVLITNGAIEAIFLTQLALLDKGDKVITIKPAYPALYQIAGDIGAEIIEWQLKFEQDFQPDLETLEELMKTHRPKMLIINFPHNPTGICLNTQQNEKICSLAREYNCYLLSDEIYKGLSFAEPVSNAFALYPEKAVTISSLSKAYGLPGLRIGWMLASPETIEKCLNLRHYTTLCVNMLGELFAVKALKDSEKILRNSISHAQKNYHLLQQKSEGWKEKFKLEYIQPQGGVMVFVRMNNLSDTEDFCIEFEKESSILLLPGNKYAKEYQQFFRLGYGGDTEEFIFCLDKLEKFLEQKFR